MMPSPQADARAPTDMTEADARKRRREQAAQSEEAGRESIEVMSVAG
jgi:hypothetical protein